MDFWLCTLLTLPVMAVCWHLYFVFRAKRQRSRKIAVKCCATLMCVVTAFMGLISGGLNPVLTLEFWAIVCCMLGDGLLEIHFITGMAAFAAGHILLILWIATLFSAGNAPIVPALLIAVCAYMFTVWLFRSNLKQLGRAKTAFLIYPACLMTMAAMAITLPLVFGAAAWSIAVGGLLFAISDLLVAKGIFDGLSPAMDRFALAIYYIAVYLIALTAWLW